MEKFFSVFAEGQDGTTKLVAAKGKTPGEAFQQIKQMPGIRRVGKVSEISQADYNAILHGRQPTGLAPAARPDRHPAADAAGASPQPGRVDVHFKLQGPRVVLDARPTGGEQPFKNLNIPPERLKPNKPEPAFQPPPVTAPIVRPAVKPQAAQPAPASQQPSEADAESRHTAASAERASAEYRVIKSRRADGAPYLLQRGHWQQLKGKRIFKVEWEKGFDSRDKADAHAGWVQRSVEELAAVSELAE